MFAPPSNQPRYTIDTAPPRRYPTTDYYTQVLSNRRLPAYSNGCMNNGPYLVNPVQAFDPVAGPCMVCASSFPPTDHRPSVLSDIQSHMRTELQKISQIHAKPRDEIDDKIFKEKIPLMQDLKNTLQLLKYTHKDTKQKRDNLCKGIDYLIQYMMERTQNSPA